jgi:hypothetical protein
VTGRYGLVGGRRSRTGSAEEKMVVVVEAGAGAGGGLRLNGEVLAKVYA